MASPMLGRSTPAAGGALIALVVPLLATPFATTPRHRLAPAASGSVTIYRDDWGVPHIYADTEEAGFLGLGYAQAEDELEPLLERFMAARGELAAVRGASAVASDIQSHLWRHVDESREGFERMSPQLQINYRGYLEGLKRYMREHPAEVPSWAPDLEPADVVAVSRWFLWLAYQAGEGLRNCQAGGATLAHGAAEALARGAENASNEWILAPWRTAMNAMTVLSDPHGGIDGSFVYEFRLDAGSLKSAGFSMGPMLILTHTRNVSWGMTTGAPDVADCYEIAVDARDSTRYTFDGERRRFESKRVTIRVKDGATVRRRLEYSRHNGVLSPVVARADGKAWVVSTAYMHDAGVFDEEVYRMNHARDVGEVKEAMRLLGMFPQNVMVGDRHGGSFYLRAGKTPIRPPGYDWSRPVSGNTSATAWLGIHPLDDLVHLENPPSGYMQNNNISPDQMLHDSPLTSDRYPAYIYRDRPGRTNTRGRRAVEVLSAAYAFSEADAISLALDEKWIDTDEWLDGLRRALGQEHDYVRAASPAFRQTAAGLLQFDGHARAGSRPARHFWHWRDVLREGIDGVVVATPDSLTPGQRLPDRVAKALVRGLSTVVDRLSQLPGGLERNLGDEFRITRGKHSFPVGGVSVAPADLSGCAALADLNRICTMTLRAFTAGAPDSTGRRHLFLGSRLLRLVIFTDPLKSYTLHNFGQSSHPDSPHYVDQARLSSERRLKPVYFERSELMPHVTSERVLEW